MLPESLKKIKPEYPDLVGYSKPGEGYLIGPDSQNSNNTAFPTEKPTRHLDVEKNKAWAQEIRNATNRDASSSN